MPSVRTTWACSRFSGRPARLLPSRTLRSQARPAPCPCASTAQVPGRFNPVLFLHGGGFVIGREGYEAPLRELAPASGCLIVSPEVRLAPEYPFPAAIDDALAAARWLIAEAGDLGASRAPAGIAGDSSGGNLAAVITHELCRLRCAAGVSGADLPDARRHRELTLLQTSSPRGSASPARSPAGTSTSTCRRASTGASRAYRPCSTADLSGLPPTLIATAECDPLRDDGERYAAALRDAGVPVEVRRYPGMIHGFFQMTAALQASRQPAQGARRLDARARRGTTRRIGESPRV